MFVVRDILCVGTHKIPRPWLAISVTTKIWLRLPHNQKTCRRAGVFVLCGPERIRTPRLLSANEAL